MPSLTFILVSAVCFGLVVGSFLNVVIYRLPLMIEVEWDDAIREQRGLQPDESRLRPTLSTPSSTCPSCGHRIRWYENIPVLSWIFLRGRCSECHERISIRYPLVEISCGVIVGLSAYCFGVSLAAFAFSFFGIMLIALTLIDLDTFLLPDSLTYPLLWTGLLYSTTGEAPLEPSQAIFSAIVGYLLLWGTNAAFMLIRKRQGMGNGDFKLLAAICAWTGLYFLPLILLIASMGGAIAWAIKSRAAMRSTGGTSPDMDLQVPFGPYLCLGGVVAMGMFFI